MRRIGHAVYAHPRVILVGQCGNLPDWCRLTQQIGGVSKADQAAALSQ